MSSGLTVLVAVPTGRAQILEEEAERRETLRSSSTQDIRGSLHATVCRCAPGNNGLTYIAKGKGCLDRSSGEHYRRAPLAVKEFFSPV
jgi:hypothetical protein